MSYQSNDNRIAIIILNYNSFSDCKDCIDSIRLQTGIDYEIVVVDNCSRPDDAEQVKDLCRKYDCTFIAAEQNRGYSAGNNVGLRYAADAGYDYMAIVNPDMLFPQHNYFDVLLSAMKQHDDVVMAGSDIILGTSKTHQNPMRNIGYYEELFWSFYLFKERYVYFPTSTYCEALSGCCFVITRDFLQEIGFMDENTFLYEEESILSSQVKRAGKKMLYVSETMALHNHKENKKGSIINRVRHLRRSRRYYYNHYCRYNIIQKGFLYVSQELQYLYFTVLFNSKNLMGK